MSSFGPLVSAQWLREHLDDVRVVDVRWYLQVPGAEDGRSGRAEYESGHIPGAVWLDMDTDLAGPTGPGTGRHPLPSAAGFAAALGRVGIADGQPVVAYDDSGGAQAARLWWMLHVLDEPVAVLDGGLNAWTAAGGELSADTPESAPVVRTVRDWPSDRFADADAILPAIGAGVAVCDARTEDRYRSGGPIDPRPGHIPGAQSAPWQGNLGEDGRFRPSEQLRERFAHAAEHGAIAYCGSGVTACHNLLAMAVAGIDDTRLYPGSWSQWGADEARPIEVDGGTVG